LVLTELANQFRPQADYLHTGLLNPCDNPVQEFGTRQTAKAHWFRFPLEAIEIGANWGPIPRQLFAVAKIGLTVGFVKN
jgi:hypothetical protein